MKRKQILVISIPYKENFMSVQIRHENITQFLSQKGMVEHLTFSPAYYKKKRSSNIFNGFSLRRLLKISEFNHDDLHIFEKQILNYLKENKVDIIMLLVRPFFLIRLVSSIKKDFPSVRIVLDMSDPCYMGQTRFIHKKIYIKWFEKKYLCQFDYLMVTNPLIKSYYSNLSKNILVIDQGINKEKTIFARKHQKTSYGRKYKELLYGGKFVKKLRDPHELFHAIVQSPLNLVLNVYGTNPLFENKVKTLSLKNKICFHPPVSQEALYIKYARTDIIVHMDNDTGFQVPGKTFELLAFDKPILFIYMNEASDTLNYLKNEQGVFCCLNKAKAIIEALDTISKEPGKRYRRNFEQFFWESRLEKIIPALK